MLGNPLMMFFRSVMACWIFFFFNEGKYGLIMVSCHYRYIKFLENRGRALHWYQAQSQSYPQHNRYAQYRFGHRFFTSTAFSAGALPCISVRTAIFVIHVLLFLCFSLALYTFYDSVG